MKAIIAAAVLALGVPALAQQQEAKPLEPGREALALPYEKYTLPNGLEVILAPDHMTEERTRLRHELANLHASMLNARN